MSKDAISLNPDNFVEGGGLIDDVDATFKECSFEMFDYNGKVIPGVPSLKIEMVVDEDEYTQYYSMGSSNDWIPSEDGSQLVSVGKASGIRSTSNGGIFLKSLIDAGFPADDLGDDITVLNALQAHMIRVPAPKRPGLQKAAREDGKTFEDTILIISEIIALPGEKSKKGKAKPPKSKGGSGKGGSVKEESGEGEGSDMEAEATTVILEILEAEGTITKKGLPAKIFQVAKENPNKNDIIKLAFNDDFLEKGPWTYEDGTLVSE